MMASGHSQIMDGPGQEPSVSLLDWSSGRGTQVVTCNVFVVGSIMIIIIITIMKQAYWVTWLLIRAFAQGDRFIETASSTHAPDQHTHRNSILDSTHQNTQLKRHAGPMCSPLLTYTTPPPRHNLTCQTPRFDLIIININNLNSDA